MSDTRLLQDPYLDWVKEEGIPVYEDFGFDLRTLDLKPWSAFSKLSTLSQIKLLH